MRFRIKVGQVFNAPVYAHVSVLLAIPFFIYNQGPFAGVFATLCYFALILIHETGHAYFVKKYQHELDSINLFAIHGDCQYQIDDRFEPETLILAGGILAQLLLLVIWLALLGFLNVFNLSDIERLLRPITYVFIQLNILTIMINALPIPGLDGAYLWKGFGNVLQSKLTDIRKKFARKPRKKSCLQKT